jgi:hypothetical protein
MQALEGGRMSQLPLCLDYPCRARLGSQDGGIHFHIVDAVGMDPFELAPCRAHYSVTAYALT